MRARCAGAPPPMWAPASRATRRARARTSETSPCQLRRAGGWREADVTSLHPPHLFDPATPPCVRFRSRPCHASCSFPLPSAPCLLPLAAYLSHALAVSLALYPVGVRPRRRWFARRSSSCASLAEFEALSLRREGERDCGEGGRRVEQLFERVLILCSSFDVPVMTKYQAIT